MILAGVLGAIGGCLCGMILQALDVTNPYIVLPLCCLSGLGLFEFYRHFVQESKPSNGT